MKYKIGNVEVEAIQVDSGNYRVETELGSVFWIIEQDFNNMTTKVKEPKFKVGDEVYYFQLDEHGWGCFQKYRIWEVYPDGYCTDNSCGHHLKTESELFTLEEAIEKLKEL